MLVEKNAGPMISFFSGWQRQTGMYSWQEVGGGEARQKGQERTEREERKRERDGEDRRRERRPTIFFFSSLDWSLRSLLLPGI